jgi:hypothetical protein
VFFRLEMSDMNKVQAITTKAMTPAVMMLRAGRSTTLRTL